MWIRAFGLPQIALGVATPPKRILASLLAEGDDRNIAMRAAQEPFRPSTQGRVALGNVGQRRARSMDQLPAQVCGRTPT